MPNPYNVAKWFWVVAGSTTQVYSSAAVDYVDTSNAAYQAWLSRGNEPTAIATEQNLMDVLALANVPLPAGKSASDAVKQRFADNVNAVLLRILFNHENRIRSLQGQGQITLAQFKTAIRNLL